MGLQILYYANSHRNLIMKICAYLPQISNFVYNARSVPVILEHSNVYPSVFAPIHILFKVLQKLLRKKRVFDSLYKTLICRRGKIGKIYGKAMCRTDKRENLRKRGDPAKKRFKWKYSLIEWTYGPSSSFF